MTDTALASREEIVLFHIREFFDQAPKENSVATTQTGEKWVADIGTWGNYLTFDVMADMTFGKLLDLVRSSEYRELPNIVDYNVWRASIVRIHCDLFLTIHTDYLNVGRFVSLPHEIRS